MKRWFVIIVILAAVQFAYAEYFHISDYQVDIQLNSDQTFAVTETITVDFSIPRHGIFRNIPYRQFFVTNAKASISNIEWALSDNYRTDYIYDIEVPNQRSRVLRARDELTIKIGRKSQMVSNEVEYVISYRVYGRIDLTNDTAVFYWNVIGHEWDAEIRHVDFHVYLPETNATTEVKYSVYTGKYGSRRNTSITSFQSGVLSGELKQRLYWYEGVTVRMEMPAELFDEAPPTGMKIRQFIVDAGSSLRVIWIPLGLLVILFVLWLFFGRDEKFIKVTEFFPPPGMSSAEAGKLIDDQTDDRDLISLFYYWAAKKVILIKEVKDEKGKDDIAVKIINPGYRGTKSEQIILKELKRKSKKKDKFVHLSWYRKDNGLCEAMYQAREEIDKKWQKDPYYHPVSMRLYKMMNAFRSLEMKTVFIVTLLAFISKAAIVSALGLSGSNFRTEMLFLAAILSFDLTIGFSYAVLQSSKSAGRIIGNVLITSAVIFLLGLMWKKTVLSYGIWQFIPLNLLSAILCMVIFDFFRRIMPRKLKHGLEKYKILKGFKEFIRRAEVPKLEQLAQENENYFYDTLPYAVAFGLGKQWSRKFKDIIKIPPAWYVSPTGEFSSIENSLSYLQHHFEHHRSSFSPSNYTAVSSGSYSYSSGSSSGGSSSGSSGFSGGGFSGGGGGGGGGGSW